MYTKHAGRFAGSVCGQDSRIFYFDAAGITAEDRAANIWRDQGPLGNHLTLTNVPVSAEFGGVASFKPAAGYSATRPSMAPGTPSPQAYTGELPLRGSIA